MHLYVNVERARWRNGERSNDAGWGGGGHKVCLYVCDIENVPIAVLDDNRSSRDNMVVSVSGLNCPKRPLHYASTRFCPPSRYG